MSHLLFLIFFALLSFGRRLLGHIHHDSQHLIIDTRDVVLVERSSQAVLRNEIYRLTRMLDPLECVLGEIFELSLPSLCNHLLSHISVTLGIMIVLFRLLLLRRLLGRLPIRLNIGLNWGTIIIVGLVYHI